jgi:hypothetical protein
MAGVAFAVEGDLDPVGNVARVPDVTVKAKFCAQERGAQFRNQFFGRVIA